MAYCELADLLNDIPESDLIRLTSEGPAPVEEGEEEAEDEVDEAIVAEAISRSDSIIDGYLSGRAVTLPLSPVPNLVKTLSVDLTVWRLYNRRFADELPVNIQKRYDNAIKLLESIRAGKINWGGGSAPKTEPAEYHTDKTSDDRLFPKSVLDQF